MIKLPWDDPEFQRIWDFWKEYKLREYRTEYRTENRENKALGKLYNMSTGDLNTAIAIIRQAANKRWRDFWPLKEQHEAARTTQPGTSEARINALKGF